MKTYEIQSTSIKSVVDSLSEDGSILINFTSGKSYRIPNATKHLLQDFLASSSKGKFFNEIIRPNYETQPVEASECWTLIGTAVEDIKAGQRVECSAGRIRAAKLPQLT